MVVSNSMVFSHRIKLNSSFHIELQVSPNNE